jgi:copper resistance protein D
VTQFLDIFGFLSVLLRGLTLAFEALTVGGMVFLLAVAQPLASAEVRKRVAGWVVWFALLLAVTQISSVAANSAILIGSTEMVLGDVAGAGFWISGLLMVVGAAGVALFAKTGWVTVAGPIACLSILAGSVMASHSVARVDDRGILMAMTLAHHLAGAVWVGGLPYLLVALRHSPDRAVAGAITSRFSRMAMISVGVLVAAGVVMSFFYVGSVTAVAETTYGIMLLLKVILTGVLVLLGALNWRIVRAVKSGERPELLPLRRFAEAELGIGFTILLAAASITSTPPAIDVQNDRVSAHEIAERFKPQTPRMETPHFSQLSSVKAMSLPKGPTQLGSFVPGQQRLPTKPEDRAWSEYNHHWSGLVVLAIGVFSLLSRWFPWAKHWPLLFLGLAVFLFIRADGENWPLGPRGFWESFQVAEVAQHRVFVLLIIAFAAFEWAVQTNRIPALRAGLVFPLVCAVGGALLITHSHSLGNVKEEFLAELSHIPLAIFAILAGWSRWLEIRLPKVAGTRPVAWIWPVCFIMVGVVLISYRES